MNFLPFLNNDPQISRLHFFFCSHFKRSQCKKWRTTCVIKMNYCMSHNFLNNSGKIPFAVFREQSCLTMLRWINRLVSNMTNIFKIPYVIKFNLFWTLTHTHTSFNMLSQKHMLWMYFHRDTPVYVFLLKSHRDVN